MSNGQFDFLRENSINVSFVVKKIIKGQIVMFCCTSRISMDAVCGIVNIRWWIINRC